MITTTRANSILDSMFNTTFYIGLSTTVPTRSGSNFTEPATSSSVPNSANGYFRAQVDSMTAASDSQTHNSEIIFFNEAVGSGWGTIVAFGCFRSRSDTTPFFVGELSAAVTVPAEYIPIFRAKQLIIGLDKPTLNTPD